MTPLATVVHDPVAADLLAGGGRVLERRAVRAVVVREGRLLLLTGVGGVLKLPGGGVEPGESDEQCLRRELEEECGMPLVAVTGVLGDVVELSLPLEREYDVFRMTSRHLYCTVGAPTGRQRLDGYEARLGLTPAWLGLHEAARACSSLLDGGDAPAWTQRELVVLRRLQASVTG